MPKTPVRHVENEKRDTASDYAVWRGIFNFSGVRVQNVKAFPLFRLDSRLIVSPGIIQTQHKKTAVKVPLLCPNVENHI